jgi:hypothetical protein
MHGPDRDDFHPNTYPDKKMERLQEFAENAWISDGPPVRDMGVWFTTHMMAATLMDFRQADHRSRSCVEKDAKSFVERAFRRIKD